MSDLRPSVWFAGSLLAVVLLCASQSVGQAIGSGVLSDSNARSSRARSQEIAVADYMAAVPRPSYANMRRPMGPDPRQSRTWPTGQSVVPEAMPENASTDGAVEGEIVEEAADEHAHVEGFPGGLCSCGGSGCEVCQCGIWAVLAAARQRSEVFYGVTAFTGPVNRGGTGSFGFEGGLNTGSPLFGGWRGLGFQTGMAGTLSNFNGSNFTRDTRNQLFFTVGFFRRVDWGLQGGLVIDHVHDDWYANVDLTQLRGEFSWMFPQGTDVGFMFAGSNDTKVVTGVFQTGQVLQTTVTETWSVNDYYAFFLRHTTVCGGYARVFAGWSGTSDGVLGAESYTPLNGEWSLRNSFTYFLPEQGPLDGGNVKEAWNLSMQMVWCPGGNNGCGRDYYRPLFNVANNGTMFIER